MKQLATNEPLLYVEQPELQRPKIKMQSEFISEEKDVQENETEQGDLAQTSFKNLSIEEKIQYLTEMPEDLFQMKCKFSTKDKTYFGRITESDTEMVEIIHSGRQRVTVNISELEQIQLIGL